jgi:hypothetical protein
MPHVVVCVVAASNNVPPIGLYGSCGTSCIAYTLRVVRLRHSGGVRDERVCADTADFETVLPLVKPIAPPHLHRDWAHPCHLCARTGLTPATSAPELGSPLPHRHRDWSRVGEGPKQRRADYSRTTNPHLLVSLIYLERHEYDQCLGTPAQCRRTAALLSPSHYGVQARAALASREEERQHRRC